VVGEDPKVVAVGEVVPKVVVVGEVVPKVVVVVVHTVHGAYVPSCPCLGPTRPSARPCRHEVEAERSCAEASRMPGRRSIGRCSVRTGCHRSG